MNKELILQKLKALDTKGRDTVSLYNEISSIVMQEVEPAMRLSDAGKAAYYLSMEFLVGRAFFNNLLEAGILDETREILAEKGVDINRFEEIEDAALGNGGLGRLAACFLDSGAALSLPLYGYGIRYRYGLFKQGFENGYQMEYPDDWQSYGDPWSVRQEKESRVIEFADMTVTAVPYDMPILGNRVNTLRLWQAEGGEKQAEISGYLYPDDSDENGKLLRIRQEYFFSAATVDELIEKFVKSHGNDFERFPMLHALQLNDTHPVFAIAEFLRVLTKQYGVSFKTAVAIAKQTFNYTNHTVMEEALEKWSRTLIVKILPDIAKILLKLSQRAEKEWKKLGVSGTEKKDMQIYDGLNFSMANTALFASNRVNGVAAIHTEILKATLFKTACKYYPEKFQNKTNGITQRRWLMLCNRELSSLIDQTIGKNWRTDMNDIAKLDDAVTEDLLAKVLQVKSEKKTQLCAYIKQHEGMEPDPKSIFFVQVKRLHEYKRQLMNAFGILALYYGLKDGSIKDFYPSTFIFGAKAASGYKRAKSIIKYINEIAKLVNNDPDTKHLLKVIFVQNYNVSYAEKIVAAADVSVQISTAGTEASGTGNMKLMMNGAVTLGTLDGANIEIVEKAGRENNYIFGATVEEIQKLKPKYDPLKVLSADPAIKKVVNTLADGTFKNGKDDIFRELFDSLIKGASWHKPDHYFVLHDLKPYIETLLKINREYRDQTEFSKKMLKNIAASAYFSSDRTVRQYADEIWNI